MNNQLSKTKKNQFKSTLNLPQTNFPMRANLAQNEPQRIKQWQKNRLYDTIQTLTTDRPEFSFHDGPPYANGNIHVGHLLNKVLKDFVVRSQLRLGNKCPYTPGWDCHGLPIEHRVMTEIISQKADKFASTDQATQRIIIRSECEKYAQKHIKLQSQQMQRLLTLADYDNPYLTMTPQFESKTLEVFASLVREGIVYRQLKPVHWSIANQTALAEAELEYEDKDDTAIFVNFESKNSTNICQLFNAPEKPTFFTIWTTTPWTLPANLAIAIHPDYQYALVEHNDTYLILANDLVEAVSSTIQTPLPIVSTIAGKSLLGQQYQHPFLDQTSPVVAADYVTLEDGTGLVHTAPGHGTDDYQTGCREQLPVYCPVQADGTYDTTVPDWLQNKLIWDANESIVNHLKQSNHLLHSYIFSHSYPHDWRSKTPVIFRSTEQWFISVDQPTTNNQSLRQMALSSINEDIDFIPNWGKNRLRGMMESRPDWCISRQRSWGLPIPAFSFNGTPFLTEQSVLAISKVFSESGSDAWFKESPEQLLRHYNPATDPDCPSQFDASKLEKLYDIFDVWFESGSSWYAVMQAQGATLPVNLYLEGSDQHRGWFHLSLLPAVGILKKPPYQQLLTHGFIVDKHGKKMSKSSGNALNVNDILTQYGAEVTRWWVSSLSFENDIKVDTSFFDQASESYRKIRNTIRFLLSNLFDYTGPKTNDELDAYLQTLPTSTIDSWVLAELSRTQHAIIDAYQQYQFKQVHQLVYNFCNDTLSSIYCAAIKDRLYCDAPQSTRRQYSQHTMAKIITVLCELLSPILPHTTEEAMATFIDDDSARFHAKQTIPFQFNTASHWDTAFTLRPLVLKALEEAKNQGLENPLDCGISVPKEDALVSIQSELADLFGVSQVSFGDQLTVHDLKHLPQCERSWRRDSTVKTRSNGALLSDRDAQVIGEQ